MFCELNGRQLEVPVDDAVAQMLGIAAGEVDEASMARWLGERMTAADETD